MRNIHSLYDYFTTIFDKFQYRNGKKYRLVFLFYIITSDNDNITVRHLKGKILQNFMSPYILLRLEPQSPMPLLSRTYAHAWHSAGSFSVTLSTQHSLTLHDHIHTFGYPKYVGGAVKFEYTSTYFLEHHDVQFVHHRRTSALFSPSPVDISVQIAQKRQLTAYGSLRQFDLWSHCRSQQYH